MEDQADDVARDEDHRVHSGLDPRRLDADVAHDIAEREVDGGGEEGGRERNAANADEEAVEREGVVPREQAANVANHFGCAAADHRAHEVRLAGDGTLCDVDDAGEGEEGEEGCVGTERGPIIHDGIFDIAMREVAGIDASHGGGCEQL